MTRFLFRPTTADFRKWCKEYVGLAFSIVRTYERWPELSRKEDYEGYPPDTPCPCCGTSLKSADRRTVSGKRVSVCPNCGEEWVYF